VIVLDTNVISELANPKPAQQVVDWLDRQDPNQIFVTAITVAELLYGLARMPSGQRRATLALKVDALLTDLFDRHTLEFTGRAAVEFAKLVHMRTRQGLPIEPMDAQIAAICRCHCASLATRNSRDFTKIGIELIDPWAE
jgi:hypothetical protein